MFGENFDQYKKESERLLIIAQIENIKAIDNLNQICDVDGLDIVLQVLICLHQWNNKLNHPDVIEACEKIFKICRNNNVVGIHLIEPNKDKLRQIIDDGHQFIAHTKSNAVL